MFGGLKWRGKKRQAENKAAWDLSHFSVFCEMKEGCLIKRSRGRRPAGRPEGFVLLVVSVCVYMSACGSHEI